MIVVQCKDGDAELANELIPEGSDVSVGVARIEKDGAPYPYIKIETTNGFELKLILDPYGAAKLGHSLCGVGIDTGFEPEPEPEPETKNEKA